VAELVGAAAVLDSNTKEAVMTKKDKARYAEIVRQLCQLSRDGWRWATRADWEPLETELRALKAKENKPKLRH
jgi:hypothetical protein